MKLTEKSLAELQIDDGELLVIRQKLTAEKQSIQGQLAELNSRCAVILPTREFAKIQSQRGQVVKMLNEKEREIGELNSRRQEVLTVLEVRKREAGEFKPTELQKLVQIRDRWHDFSMDAINPKSARETAWKISQELRQFLKPYFNQE